ncbi:hypothetical protein LOC68_18340 [Blastopirellula sp. JC732]|uniref:Uncharacterized protein n=1 Tax=Blastopirellula sediminis TaxID=2894196 RepID=A0A9X1SL61_9BACT|nr:hypothetical protein [Blastopirellula sediminis]MCC9606343.1 hypothetical protein [Blastopirellula sediminis]MCC9630359.1 hypothetical protein [Blastopirellula sediminis]
MPDRFDPYREALIVEERTIWPADCEIPLADRGRIERLLQGDAASCSHLEYVRVHTGFCRTITVTAEDLDRVGARA